MVLPYTIALKLLRLFCLITNIATVFGDSVKTSIQDDRRTGKGMNLLKDLNLQNGVEQVLPSGLHLTPGYIGHGLPDTLTRHILSEYSGELSLYLAGSLFDNKTLPIITITNKKYRLPYLEILLDILDNNLIIKYLGDQSLQRITLSNVLPSWEWRKLLITINGTELKVQVDCGEELSRILSQKLILEDSGSEIWFGVSSDRKHTFQGMLFEASLYLSAETNKCTNKHENELQSDEGGIILGIGTPFEDRILLLEQQITQLNVMVNMMKDENKGLSNRISVLETCECRPSCTHNGSVVPEGGVWSPDLCTFCQCLGGRPSCSRRLDIPSCATPCLTNPCSNNGECIDVDISGGAGGDFTCQCQSPYDGTSCQNRQNPCALPLDSGTCDELVPRYYYDKHNQHCLPFNFTGCGGNANNFRSEEECNGITMKGACCYRTYSIIVPDILQDLQTIQTFCQSMDLLSCQRLHRQNTDNEVESEVISFVPGMTCEEAGCLNDKGCLDTMNAGDDLRLGCQSCTCLNTGAVTCRCTKMTVRKEMRDMSREEFARFQNAVLQLKNFGDVSIWDDFRDLYMKHSMHSNGGQFYLLWHRLFLRRMEQKLQEIDCDVILPYIDFSTDVGAFSQAMIWQTQYFGGNGEENGCVTDHPFGGPTHWKPCIMRDFNTSVKLPSAIELALALASDDYSEMSLCLETYAAYVHNYIGGDMATTSAPYDPVFYSIHAYIDMLYWTWQQRQDNKFKFPAVFGSIPLIPFNVLPSEVLDSDALCVTYVPPSRGHICNETVARPTQRPGEQRGDQSPEVIDNQNRLNQFGYDVTDIDIERFNRYGFKQDGYNVDGYDKEGYDRLGYNRYGRDREGYDIYGFNVNGRDRNGNIDNSDRFSQTGYDSNCLDIHGLSAIGTDRYGFNIHGYDRDGCNYLFHGPFSVIHSYQIMQALGNQGKGFLMSLYRTCPALDPVPNTWYQQFWTATIKDVTDMVPTKVRPLQTLTSSKFCIETESILSPCACQAEPSSICEMNPCLTDTCSSYPEAVCHFSYCGDCKATWYFRDMEIDCNSVRDYCDPNPCEHGGTCVPSVWSSDPSLVTCICPPGYDGHLCQYEAVDICSLPLDTGSCNNRVTRWQYNYKRQTCEEFIYSGCQGNSNNFLSVEACQNRCVIGACCYREPMFKKKVIGYSLQGFDKYGYSVTGTNIAGDRVTIQTATEFGGERFGQGGLDWQGYDREGYDLEGYNRFGYNIQGFNREGFNAVGYSTLGEYDGIIDYNQMGFDMDGFNRAGFSCLGINRLGINAYKATAAYKYSCQPMTMDKCQSLERDGQTEVVKYSIGQTCDQTNCSSMCGCTFDNRSYKIGDQFKIGCQMCRCTITGTVSCQCEMPVKRKEVRDMSDYDLKKYQEAIKSLQLNIENTSVNKWFEVASMYANHKPQAVGTNLFLPWNRYFLRLVERHLQDKDCSISIPYYDWTVDVGNPSKSIIWAVNMFGGNGMGTTGCVRHHPFKDFYPPYWSPCLRRQFNTSVQLPDAVHVQLALNEPRYEHFRIRMEIFAKLYQGFVGGHLASDYAPYDPLYFSLMAYIDKLWNDWQMKYTDGFLRFPRQSLFIPMVPFKSTPDEVMESKLQMCVEYIDITKGSQCNITEIRHYGYDENGFDRHGYDSSGYDKDGYDMTGLSIDSQLDTRGIFGNTGYNQQGYGRDGYDSSGFDLDGFYVDTYNLDGYDYQGYDRSGFDRYGFDKDGLSSTGYYQNGSINMNVVTSHVNVYDSYGFNKYGYNTQGFNRDGYDAYGFDINGLDKMKCNYYYLGPMYMLVKQYVKDKLKNLDNETLININRPCPTVSELEEWQLNSNWLKRNNQRAMIETIDFTRNGEPYTQDDKVWSPTPPDDRLCLVSQVFSNCEIGQVPVLCEEDLCKSRTCPGHPTAVCRTSNCDSCYHEWYDGITGHLLNCTGCTTYENVEKYEGEEWKNSVCDNCRCENGMILCEEIICPPIYCQHPIRLPDQCCPSCDGCDFDGKIVPTGTRFRPDTDRCSVCDCMRGNITCRAVPCQPIENCQTEILPPGECCPVCLDCGPYADGQQWNPSPCQSCICESGETKCEQIECQVPNCAHPYTPEGSCCPVCDGCFYQGDLYQNNQRFKADECTVCKCFQGNVECQAPECAPLTCRNPVTPPGQCCPSCDNDCDYEGSEYQHRTSFTPIYNSCLNCSCDNTMVRCSRVQCDIRDLPCESPITKPGDCCPSSCPQITCQHEGKEYNDGETWTPRSPCQMCVCRNGRVSCRTKETCSLECTHGVVNQGKCCSACSDCLYDGRIITNGNKFTRNNRQQAEPCQQCTCTDGNIECVMTGPCPSLPCTRPRTERGHCCPSCPVCEFEGRKYEHGEMVSKEQCLDCNCLDGQIICEKQKCPQKRCRQPYFPENECCPQCNECEFYNQVFNEGQQFLSPRDSCQSCICKQGEVTCKSIKATCPNTQCSHPQKVRNQCCRRCEGCEYLGRNFQHGQKFAPPRGGDMCTVCSCQYGSVKCERMECPDINCLQPQLLPGACCPVCSAVCQLDGQQYEHGEQFSNPRDHCSMCNCQDGEIKCIAKDCPILSCSHPAAIPNECCPSCDFCLFDRRIFRNMQRFIHPDDTCQKCICQGGSVTCTKINCPVLPCRDSMPMAGSCCHVCPKSCNYRGLTYNDGQTFNIPGESCKDCLCRQGQVQCQQTACKRVNCQHPADEDCCPICENCFYQGLLWRNGQRFKDQQNPCIKCQCSDGNVNCQQKQCPPVACDNPMLKDCCPVCSECKLGNKMYRNRQSFTNPKNKCETCLCEDGNVDCKQSMCPPAPCEHPVKDGCCMVCSDCKLGERTYRNGQSFPSRQNQCDDCTCMEGTVNCLAKQCPPVMCSNPAQGQCCKECRHCDFNGQTVREGNRIQDPSDTCKECECRLGSIMCFQRQCSNSVCTHPVQNGCCQDCTKCMYNGQIMRNGQEFPDAGNNCKNCRCENGNVVCREKVCSVPNCGNPVQGKCCLECTDCIYNDRSYQNGEEFPDISNQCNICRCRDGTVDCSRSQCPATICSHPVQGPCCPQCGGNCLYQNREYLRGQEFEKDCKSCTCINGNVQCVPKYCPPVTCSNPVTKDCCPVCDGCMFENRRFRNGQSFPDVQDECSQCICKDGSFECSMKPCPPVNCDNPSLGECCPECRNCDYNNQTIQHGYRFPDPSDPCTVCTCELGSIRCKQKSCPSLNFNCQHPVVDVCGCRSCDQCDFEGQIYQNQQKFNHATHSCLECTCRRGTVDCQGTACSISCTHPATESGCCPECKDCLYEGKIHQDDSTFISDVDPCQQTTCRRGSILTQTIQCPPPSCLNPVKEPTECCYSCPVCKFLGDVYNDNTQFTHPQDPCQVCDCQSGRVSCLMKDCDPITCSHPRHDMCCSYCDQCYFEDVLYDNGESFQPDQCRSCYCQDGSVTCKEEKCLNLPCLMTETQPGACCPVCKGCTYKDVQYNTGTTWILPDNSCVSCTCHGGLVTCMELECYVPCNNPITLPGQCCPVCPTCVYNGKTYNNGDSFSPNGDPCDTCTCQGGNLQCNHESCPNIANCPPEQLVPSQTGECCPTCAGFGTNCTRSDLGMRIRPRLEDPCFYCECANDFNWICAKDECPPLNCPPNVQLRLPGQCCPVCPACFDSKQGRYYNDGESWIPENKPCESCQCLDNLIQCRTLECPPIVCGVNELLINIPNSCCSVCQPLEIKQCFYLGRQYQAGEQWNVDECTKCQCLGGEVNCNSIICQPTDCKSNEVPSLKPGTCCPVCEQQPGSCLVFGDPHYRTFDGTTIHFQGQCKYIMAADCETDTFSVEVQHDNRDVYGDVSWAQNFTVKVSGFTVDLLQKHAVQVNGERVSLPYLNEPYIQIELSGNTVLLNTNIGLKITWNGDSYAEVSIPGTYKRKLCGLCGNFNGFPQDDLRTRLGQITNSPAVFGNSWKAKTQYKGSCKDAKDLDPCIKAGYRVRKVATTKCAVIKSNVFSRCHRAVSPEPFFASCVYDMCVCMDNPDCLCDILSSYAHVCAKAGAKVQWRTNNLCAFDCPANSGLVFDDCGPACPRTCENMNTPLGNVSENCFKPCVASCQCAANQVLYNGRCINPKDCPKINTK